MKFKYGKDLFQILFHFILFKFSISSHSSTTTLHFRIIYHTQHTHSEGQTKERIDLNDNRRRNVCSLLISFIVLQLISMVHYLIHLGIFVDCFGGVHDSTSIDTSFLDGIIFFYDCGSGSGRNGVSPASQL